MNMNKHTNLRLINRMIESRREFPLGIQYYPQLQALCQAA